jgi:small-conductance mechanosensitive channel
MFKEILSFTSQSKYLAALLIFLLSLAGSKLVFFFFKKILLRLTKKTETEIDDKIIEILRKPVFYTVIVIGILISLSYISLPEKFAFYTTNLIKTFLALVWISAVKIISDTIIENLKRKKKVKSAIPLIANLSGIVIYFVGLLLILNLWGFDITPLLASAGIAGFAIALAAKDTIANFFGGITIFLDKPYRVGDIIQLETNEIGEIIKVGVRSTRIRTRDDTIITVPNSVLANSKIINLSEPRQKLRVNIPIGVSYGTDIKKVEKILLEIAKKNKNVLEEPESRVKFIEFGQSSLNFVLRCWVAEPFNKGKVIDQVNREINERFKKEKIEIPFPQMDVHLKK